MHLALARDPTPRAIPENALPEVVDAEEAKRQLAVTTAVQWVNESMTEQLWGLIPFNQAEVDSRLRIFFENKVQEDKERRELERSPEEPVLVPSPLMPQPPPPPAPKKKGQKQGRRDTLVEKPVLPAEPPEPILHGSMAIGAVSLAVIKASAHLTSTPLYMSITSLKHGQQPITGKMSHLGCLTINYDTIEQPLLLIQGVCSSLGLELGTNLHLAINCAAHELMDYSKGKYEVMVGAHKNMAEMMELYVDLINKYPFIIALIDPFRKEAVGLGARFIKLGGLSRGERVTKYNRLLTIEEELIQSGTWGFSEEHNFSSFQEDAEKTLESTAMMAEETLGPLESIFPTEV
ncbi:enolase 4 [Cricetulus griseus]